MLQAKQLSSGAPSRKDGSAVTLSRASIINQPTPGFGQQQANSTTKKMRWVGKVPLAEGVHKGAANVEFSG